MNRLTPVPEQVRAGAVFLTDGPSRTVKIGTTTIQLRRTTPKNMEAAGRLRGPLITPPHFVYRTLIASRTAPISRVTSS